MPERLGLKRRPVLRDFQEYIQKVMDVSGQQVDKVEETLLLFEQLGRLAKAMRVDVGLSYDSGSQIPKKDDALAGLLFYTVNLANHLGINLETAFRARENRQKRRKNRE